MSRKQCPCVADTPQSMNPMADTRLEADPDCWACNGAGLATEEELQHLERAQAQSLHRWGIEWWSLKREQRLLCWEETDVA